MAKLVAQSGPTAGREFPLDKDLTAMGRQSTQDVQIVDNMASRAHCQIRRDGRFYSLVDLGSRNGTLLNGRKVAERLLNYGDRIRVGEVEFLLVKEAGDVELADLLTKYELKEKLGEGGMGIVYKAVQKSMAREVALKILAPRHAQKPKFVEQFINEARAAGKLNHHHLIQVHDVGTENDLHYFSMEFVDGPTAMDLLRRQGPLETEDALEIIRQVSRALGYAHDHRLIHQDIKPDNIMVGTNNVVKLADLGISKSFDEAEAQTENKKIMGTPAYMAPEAALGKRIDHRVDIYSLGTTLFHLLAGRTPFPGQNPTEILKAHVSQMPPRLRDLNPKVSEPVEALVNRLMAKNPDERPQSAAEIEAALDKIASDNGAKGEDRTETNILRRYAAGSSAPREDTPEAPLPNLDGAETSTSRKGTKLAIGAAVLAACGVGAWLMLDKEAPAPTPTPTVTTTGPVTPVGEHAPVEPPKTDPSRSAMEAVLNEIDAGLSKSLDQVDVVALGNRLRTLPATLPKDLADRRDACAVRLRTIEQQAAVAKLLDQFAQVRSEAQTLVEADDYDQALAKLEAFPGKAHPKIAERLAEAQDEITRAKTSFVSDISDRAQSLALRKDLAGLRQLKTALPGSFTGSPLEAKLLQSIKTLEDERQAAINASVAAASKDFRDWNFKAIEERLLNQRSLLSATPAEEQLKGWIATGKRLDELAAAVANRLKVLRQQRYRGLLAGFPDPDLMSADREQGLELKESNGGAVYLRWGKIPAKDLQTVADLLLKQDAAAFKPAIDALGQAAQAK